MPRSEFPCITRSAPQNAPIGPLSNGEVVARIGNLPMVPRSHGGGLMGHYMKRLEQKESRNTKRSIKIDGHPSSVPLEDAFWNALKEIAATRNVQPSDLVATINKERQHARWRFDTALVQLRSRPP
jgi:predicted DNA-binding ribbon-helix-helix protein